MTCAYSPSGPLVMRGRKGPRGKWREQGCQSGRGLKGHRTGRCWPWGLSGTGTGEGSRCPSSYVFLLFGERPYFSKTDYDTKRSKTHSKRRAFLRCCDQGSPPGGGELKLGSPEDSIAKGADLRTCMCLQSLSEDQAVLVIVLQNYWYEKRWDG